MLKDKDKKLVWSLEDALNEQRESGNESDKLGDKIRIKDIDPNKDMLIYEYEVKEKPFDAAKNSSSCVMPKWLIALLALFCAGLLIAIIVILALKTATPASYQSYNSACDNNTKVCDASKGLVCTNGICDCSSLTPTLVDNSYCVLGNSYKDTCSTSADCDTSKNLQCIGFICLCKNISGPLHFWSENYQTCRLCPDNFSISTSSSGISYCYGFQSTCTSNSSRMVISSQDEFENLKIFLTPSSNQTFRIGATRSGTTWNWDDSLLTNGDTATFSDSYRWCGTTLTNQFLTATYITGSTDACVNSNSGAPTMSICEVH